MIRGRKLLRDQRMLINPTLRLTLFAPRLSFPPFNQKEMQRHAQIVITMVCMTNRACLGDLKENAEYHAAREQQGMVEARIRDIEGRLQNSVVIDVTTIPKTGKVIFGTTVEIANVETDESVVYHIVGEDEADFKLGKISVGSPLARALIAKEEGDVVAVKTPGGVIEYEIVEVRHV